MFKRAKPQSGKRSGKYRNKIFESDTKLLRVIMFNAQDKI